MLRFERFYISVASDIALVARLLRQMTDLKSEYWECTLREVGECIDAINEADDIAGQNGLLMSPAT